MSEDKMQRPVLSDRLRQFIWRRIAEIWAVFLILSGLALALILLSSDASDPSSHTASSGVVQNLLGPIGAEIAAQLFSLFSLAALLVPISLLFWGWRILRHHPVRFWRWRIAGFMLSLIALSTAIISLDTGFGFGLFSGFGYGAVGPVLLGLSLPLFTALGLPDWLAPDALAGLVFLAVGLPLFIWSSVILAKDWFKLAALMQRLAALLSWPVRALYKKIGDRKPLTKNMLAKQAASAEKKSRKAKPKSAKKSPRKEPSLFAQAEESAAASAQTGSGKSAKSSAKTAQAQFDFDSSAGFRLPPADLLKAPRKAKAGPAETQLQENAAALENVLGDFRVQGQISDVQTGPVVTRYDLEPAPGTKSQRVIALADDIARSMSAMAVRVAVVPGQNVIGIELPNKIRETVLLRDVMDGPAFEESKASLPIALGQDIAGGPVVVDLAKMPHLLVAGTTGSGKSVGVNAMILSLLYRHTPETCRLIMIDPKMLELSVYDGIPHLLSPVVTDPSKAVMALKWTVREMENRYRNMAKMGVRNIAGYNERLAEARTKGEVLTRRVQTGFDAETGKPVFEEEQLDLAPLPFIVVIIDEVADLMLVAGKEIEAAVQRLAQMARAAGIHVIMATQRPSVDVITGTIKANFPTRISFQVTSRIDSRTILGEQGAEQLLGRGDMLYMEGGGRIMRVHGPFMEDAEVEKVANFLRAQGEPEYDEQVTEDNEDEEESAALAGGGAGSAGLPAEGASLYDQAVALVIREQRASTSFVQRHLKIGYNRAATLIEEMETAGIISPANHVGKRDVLIQPEEQNG